MDGRGWPWKRKSSDKATTEKPVAANESVGASLSSLAFLENQEKYKNTNYVQITMETYTRMSGLGDEVKLLEDEVKNLKEKLSAAHSEIKAKESLILQHTKVAEEAVTGWEKADAESLALKRQLESVTLLKLTVEDRASRLDDALKECMRQIRSVKDESDQRLHDIILAKTIQWDKIKAELEGKIDELNQGLLRAAAENAALSRSLQDRSNMLVRINDEKSQAKAEVEFLKSNIQLHEKQISSLKYDLHVVSKELDIRNEEKNMSLKSAEMANKQHLEGVKKIAKLEAECQRLRGLVRKKLPGPAALAQMKLEVENFGHELTEPRTRRNIAQNPGQHASSKPEISTDMWDDCKRENAFLNGSLLAMEEETKKLKEILAARNNELQVSRNLCAKTLGKLKSLEAQVQMLKHDKNSPKSNQRNHSESPSSEHADYPPSATSVSEDGFDEEGSSSEHGHPTSSDSHKLRASRSVDGSCKLEISNRLELMDDFLEIERLAASDPDGAIPVSNSDKGCSGTVMDKISASDSAEQYHVRVEPAENGTDNQLLSALGSRIYKIFESQNEGISSEKVKEAIKVAIQEMQGSSAQQLSGSLSEVDSMHAFPQVADEAIEQKISSSQDTEPGSSIENPTGHNLESAVSFIRHFMVSTIRAVHLQEMHEKGLTESLEDFSRSVDKFSAGETRLIDLVLKLSHILSLASNLNYGDVGLKHHSAESSAMESTASERIDKVTLLVNGVDKSDSDPSGKTFTDRCCHRDHSCSKTESPRKDNLNNGLGVDVVSCKSLSKELEQLKLEKDNIALELATCLQIFESTKLGLEEKEQLISELKSQLASSQNYLSLAETQLKCVTESYKSLELHARDLEAEVRHLQEKAEKLGFDLSEEKHGHADTQALYRDLQEKMQRNETCGKCSSPASYSELQAKQEKEIASAAEKLAACQETIHLLSKQLQALQPQTNIAGFQSREKLQLDGNSEGTPDHDFSESTDSKEFDQTAQINNSLSSTPHHNSSDFASNHSDIIQPIHSFRSPVSSTHPDHTIAKSSSFSSSSKGEHEKHTRGFGRFFSSKGKNGR